MAKNQTRRTFLKRTLGSFLTVLGLSSGGYLYANRIEPSLLDIQELQIKHPLIPNSFDGIKMIQFSDTHLGFQYNLHQFNQLVKKINSLKPDIILFTGDLMDEPNQYTEINKLMPILKKLQAPLGKYCIFGNHDHGGYGSDIYRNIMETTDFSVLMNDSAPIKLSDGSIIYLLGIDDAMLGNPNLPLTLKNVPKNSFKILLSHAPDLAETASLYPVQWQLSGHSHGGQIKIPFLGALVTPPFGQIYPEGLYSIGEHNPLSLYVNRGIGTTRLPFRFMSKPELTVFTLKSEK
ncbi:metallophosphoesterase [Bacillus sp. ISL-40]|uniref:metallophosphoesterase n=1 Tax=unclassified Bacillus (in: firmicutes) TaxID=185979 RepID=UPI001BE940AC|nr:MULTISPECIES: metallophosphoesterase [unclassified Bacillus (in: firmicutes)]MBT2698455.1 metallophosphoesterase [Bacillus sp. ISL-40]MBT2722474.1 metallophosphoesterase [Bacillus sp. ISL-46]MBT2741401.1 metallophosphoesterase [Bacillus sp. ISL-77]